MNYDTNHIQSGVKGGLIAGVIFGAMMGMMGMLPMFAKLLGGSSAIFGFVSHLVFSAIIGGIFGLVFGHMALNKGTGVVLGLLYGFIWWILGPLVIMPVWLGMGLQLSAKGVAMAIPSLWGHLVFGFILGLIYPMFAKTENQIVDTK